MSTTTPPTSSTTTLEAYRKIPVVLRILRAPTFGILLLTVALVILGLSLTRVDWLMQGTIALTLGIAATGLGLALGLAGEFVLGISLVMAAGAYTTVALSNAGWNFWLSALVGMAVAIVIGVVMSLPGLRVGHFYFGMLGFFLVYLIPTMVQVFEPVTGGSEGVAVLGVPDFFGIRLSASGMFVLAAIALCVALLFARNVRSSPLGVKMRRMRDSPVILATTGTPVWRVRLATYVFASVLAGLGGAVYSHVAGFVQPGEFSLEMTNMILAAVIVGGSRSLLGPVIGVIVLYVVPRMVLNIEGWSDIVYGVIIVISILVFRGGVVQATRDLIAWIQRKRGRKRNQPQQAVIARSPEGIADHLWALRASDVGEHEIKVIGARKRYGGVVALDMDDEQEISVKSGEIHLLLGPNGSGKTTLLNVISGLVRVDAGTVTFDGKVSNRMPVHKIAELGVSRSFQGPALPDEVTPVELFAAAIANTQKTSYFHWLLGTWVAARARRRATGLALQLADEAGLGRAGLAECRGLTSGQRRIVDVVLSMISSRSTIVLLDEPAAGLSEAERKQLANTIRALTRRGIGFIVVEHDLELALGLADRVTVMASGRPIAAGSADEIRDSAIVREVLIGGTH